MKAKRRKYSAEEDFKEYEKRGDCMTSENTKIIYVVWTQYQENPYDVNLEKAFTDRKSAKAYTHEIVKELRNEGYIVYEDGDKGTVMDDDARVWIEKVELKGE